MRIFVSPTGAEKLSHAEQSALAYLLLDYAVGRTWGEKCGEIAHTEAGKPFFVGRNDRFFSISHTEGYVLAAVSPYPIGADIQAYRTVSAALETRLLHTDFERELGLFETFSARESIFKLTGRGSLRRMRLVPQGENITAAEQREVKCRLYPALPRCPVTAACTEGAFPPEIEIVPQTEFCT